MTRPLTAFPSPGLGSTFWNSNRGIHNPQVTWRKQIPLLHAVTALYPPVGEAAAPQASPHQPHPDQASRPGPCKSVVVTATPTPAQARAPLRVDAVPRPCHQDPDLPGPRGPSSVPASLYI